MTWKLLTYLKKASPGRPSLARAALLLVLSGLGACAREPYAPTEARAPAEAARPLPAGVDSVHHLAAGRHYNQHGGLYQAFFGEHYRPVWAAPVSAPVLDLQRAGPKGTALRAHKAGGGYQSISLTLRTAGGREYALRALDKDPRKTLPPWLRGTFVMNMMRDGTSAANPYAALVVTPLAEAAGLVVSHPRLVYVRPDEQNLAESSTLFQGRLALLEEKYDGKRDLTPALAGASDIIDSEELVQRLYADPHHRIDEAYFLKAQLLDLWLGDWDRHEGQWQWAEYAEAGGRHRYRAIPKDRDQVFFRFNDGAFTWFTSLIVPRFQTFGPRYGNIAGLVQQATFIDQRGLSQRSRVDFRRAATELQAHLPDSLIERAVRRFPPSVYALEGARTAAALRARRDALPQAAEEEYEVLARQPIVGGTNQAERVMVNRYADSTTVRVWAPALGRDSLRFQRTFFRAETKRITLQALGGNDRLEVHTAGRRAGRQQLLLFAGAGADRVQTTGPTRRIRLYDEEQSAASSLRARKPPRGQPRYDRLDR